MVIDETSEVVSFSGLVTLFSICREVIATLSVPVPVNSDANNFVILGEVVLVDMEKLDCVPAWVTSDVMVCTFKEVWF